MSIKNFKKELKVLLNKHNATIEPVFDEYDEEYHYYGLVVWLVNSTHTERSDLNKEDLMPDKEKK